MAYALDKRRASDALYLLAIRHDARRPKTAAGTYAPVATVEPGKYRCCCCKEVKPLDVEHFWRDSTKSTGFQSRCKHCDNRLKSRKRRGEGRIGLQLLIAAGVAV